MAEPKAKARGEEAPAAAAVVERAPIPLTGHSGAEVVLLQRGNAMVVRKTAGAPAQNRRLMDQADKQRGLLFSGLPFPAVLASGLGADGRAFFEMEYLTGRTSANIIADAMVFDHRPLLAAVARLFDFLRLTEAGPLPASAFADKIAAIAASTSPAIAPHAGAVRATAAQLAAGDWSGVPQSACHGDLTLENIMITEKRGPVFIDCDVCFVSSWWLDAAKLFQDVAGHWCLRHLYLERARPAALLNATELLSGLDRQLRRLIAERDGALPARLSQLAALHLFRTVPYAKNARTVGFVLGRIERLLAGRA